MMHEILQFIKDATVYGVATMFVFVIILLIIYVANYYDTRAEVMKKVTPEQQALNSTAVLLMIDRIIDSILMEKHDLQIQFNTPFDMLKLDKDAEELAKKIHASLNPEIFKESDNYITTPLYIESYIVNTLTIKMIDMYSSTNIEIAQRKSIT